MYWYRTVVAYGEHERMVGDSAVAQMKSNFKNTIPYVNRFLGLTGDCKEQLEEETKYISNKVEVGADKKITFSVTNRGENLDLVPEQVYATYLKKLKRMFAHEDDLVDIVLAVPVYYSLTERQALLDACKVAKVNCLRLMNDNTAIALGYGFYKRKEFTEKATNIVFLDMGHGKTTCTVAAITNKKVTILSHASDRNLGGRAFDYLLCDIIGKEFADKYGCDPRKAPKARLRMLDQIEKNRKILSANTEVTVSIEALLEDEDLHRNLTRDELHELIQPNIEQLKRVCEKALNESGLKDSDIERIELVGEATRMPLVKQTVEQVFNKDKHHRTINSSECVARGCSLMAAMILPQFQVANFEIQESNPFPIDISWSISNNKMKTQTLFTKGCNFPSVKSLTFDGRSEPMDVGVSYTNTDGIIAGTPQLLARYKIEPPKPKEEKFSLKLRVQLDQNCVPALDSAELLEEYTEIRKIPVKPHTSAKPAPKEGDKEGEGEKAEDAQKEPEYQYEEKEVKKTRNTQIHFKFEHHGYGAKRIDEFVKAEDEMCKQDNMILEVKIMRNHLETYVYDMRAALDTIGNYRQFMKDDARENFLQLLNETENWIYDEGESAAKDVYKQKLEHLEQFGEPVKLRYRFHDVFPFKINEFEDFVKKFGAQAAEIPEDSHITAEEKDELFKSLEENGSWVANARALQASHALHEDPIIDLVELEQRRHKLQALAQRILNKPVPAKGAAKENAAEPKGEEAKEEAPQAEGKQADSEMKGE